MDQMFCQGKKKKKKGTKWVDKIGRTECTNMYRIDQCGHNGSNRNKSDQVGPKWIA